MSDEVRARRKAIQTALRSYLSHRHWCTVQLAGRVCSCGLDALVSVAHYGRTADPDAARPEAPEVAATIQRLYKRARLAASEHHTWTFEDVTLVEAVAAALARLGATEGGA
jgi:hypothetical protein